MATHSSILAWKIPWTEEPGRLQSLEKQRVRHNLAMEYVLKGSKGHVTKIFRLFIFDVLIPYKGKCSNLYKVLDY